MKKDNPGRDLLMLLLGMALTVAGLFIFFSLVRVNTSYGIIGGANFTMFGVLGSGVPSGIIIIPLIIGVVLMVIYSDKLWPKIFTGLAVLLIVLAIIDSVRLSWAGTNFIEFIIPVLMIFVGAALCIKILFGAGKKDDK